VSSGSAEKFFFGPTAGDDKFNVMTGGEDQVRGHEEEKNSLGRFED
jgi:hypothetical protein